MFTIQIFLCGIALCMSVPERPFDERKQYKTKADCDYVATYIAREVWKVVIANKVPGVVSVGHKCNKVKETKVTWLYKTL
jgi:hypothetical protein